MNALRSIEIAPAFASVTGVRISRRTERLRADAHALPRSK
jgi:hypothetical protein